MGNLMAGLVTEDALRQLFNSTMRAAFPAQCPPGMEPVVSVSLHSEGRYAFVELRTPEMASAALQLSNQACHDFRMVCEPCNPTSNPESHTRPCKCSLRIPEMARAALQLSNQVC